MYRLFGQDNQSNKISPLWFWWTLKFLKVCCTEVWNLEKSCFSNYFCCLNNFKVASKKNCGVSFRVNNLSVLSVYSASERKIDHIYTLIYTAQALRRLSGLGAQQFLFSQSISIWGQLRVSNKPRRLAGLDLAVALPGLPSPSVAFAAENKAAGREYWENFTSKTEFGVAR